MLLYLLSLSLWAQPALDPIQTRVETQIYLESRVPPLPALRTQAEWDAYATKLRARILDEVVFRGKAKDWRKAPKKVEWFDVVEGEGYRIRKLRYEAVPGLVLPALLYEPAKLSGKTAAVLHLNGHEGGGTSIPYIQARCISLAKRGVISLNPEWIGRGQMPGEGLNHYEAPQIDLTGTSQLAVFYLAMERALDILVDQPNVDRERIAATGLSGGGWQTTFISALDTRIKLSVPVAGHSSFVTRAQWPSLDLGDSEQTPSDLGAVADYLHLTSLTAPRPLLLIHNAKDSCCFQASYAQGPLLQSARGVFSLYGALDKLRSYANFEDGHNYGPTSRRELYEFLKANFGVPQDTSEALRDADILTPEQVRVPMPAQNGTFRSIATELSKDLPRKNSVTREELKKVLRLPSLDVQDLGSGRLRMGGAWTVPVAISGPPSATETVLILADDGRQSVAGRIAELQAQGKRVAAMDPFYFGESKLGDRDYLFAMLLAALGERPLGLQTAQVIAAAKWAGKGSPVTVEAHGRRTSLIALLAAATDDKNIAGLKLHGAMQSLKQIIQENIRVDQQPEMFCFGLLETADIPQIAKLVAPRPVELASAARKLLVISVDGLDHRYLRDADKLGLRIPNMRRLASRGEWANGVVGVSPTITWPSHTTLITGVRPDRHGILGNTRPKEEGGEYYWSANLLKVKTLWHATRAAGKTSAAITWPVTVDAAIDYNLPEAFSRRNGGAMDMDTIEAKGTPGLVKEIAQEYPSFAHDWMDDRSRTLATVYLLKNKKPDLLLLHLVDHDSEAHTRGPYTREAKAVIEYTDELIGQMLAAAGPDYVVALTSDHGFERTDRIVAPPVTGPGVKVTPTLLLVSDQAALAALRKANVGREVGLDELRRFTSVEPGVIAAFEPPLHALFGKEDAPGKGRGTHGLWPLRPDYRSTFLLYGPGIAARRTPEIQMVDIAAKLAAVLGVPLP